MMAIAELFSLAMVAPLLYPDGASMQRGCMLVAAACEMSIVTTVGGDMLPSLVASIEPASTHDGLPRLCTSCVTDGHARNIAHWRSVALAGSVVWDATVDAYCTVYSELGLRRTRRG